VHEPTDPVAEALQTLRATPWPGQPYDTQLEEKLMQAFATQEHRSHRHHRTWLAALIVLGVGGVVFAAAGGINLVRSWIVHARIETSDGRVIETTAEVVPDEHGVATLTVPGLDGGEDTIVIQPDEQEDGHTQMTVTMGSMAPTTQEGQETQVVTVTIDAQESETDK